MLSRLGIAYGNRLNATSPITNMHIAARNASLLPAFFCDRQHFAATSSTSLLLAVRLLYCPISKWCLFNNYQVKFVIHDITQTLHARSNSLSFGVTQRDLRHLTIELESFLIYNMWAISSNIYHIYLDDTYKMYHTLSQSLSNIYLVSIFYHMIFRMNPK